jgi:phosphonate transport system ATP-binding protein
MMSDLERVAREDHVLTLISIHQVEFARQFVDRIIGIAQGVVVFDGPPQELDQAMMDRIYRFDKQTRGTVPHAQPIAV